MGFAAVRRDRRQAIFQEKNRYPNGVAQVRHAGIDSDKKCAVSGNVDALLYAQMFSQTNSLEAGTALFQIAQSQSLLFGTRIRRVCGGLAIELYADISVLRRRIPSLLGGKVGSAPDIISANTHRRLRHRQLDLPV